MMENCDVHDSVKDYYGKRLQSRDDLQTQACLTPGKKITKPVREAIAAVHHEVAIRYYGCGLAIPEKLEGMKILDLGSGSGRDCFALSKLVGSNGHVTGIDMTDEQIVISRKFIDYHMETFGYSQPNVEFIQGYIEKLREAGLKESYDDIIISNCTVNLSPDKRAVIQEAYNVLKVGGELYFSDIYVDRELEDSIRKHEILWGEGFSGALYWKDLHKIAADVGFSRPFLVTATRVSVDRDDFKKIIGDAKYVSATYRLFKLPADSKETGAKVVYNGEIPNYAEQLAFDRQHTFKKGDVVEASAEVVAALKCSRFADEFDYQPASNKCETEQNGTTTMEDPFDYIAEKEKKG